MHFLSSICTVLVCLQLGIIDGAVIDTSENRRSAASDVMSQTKNRGTHIGSLALTVGADYNATKNVSLANSLYPVVLDLKDLTKMFELRFSSLSAQIDEKGEKIGDLEASLNGTAAEIVELKRTLGEHATLMAAKGAELNRTNIQLQDEEYVTKTEIEKLRKKLEDMEAEVNARAGKIEKDLKRVPIGSTTGEASTTSQLSGVPIGSTTGEASTTSQPSGVPIDPMSKLALTLKPDFSSKGVPIGSTTGVSSTTSQPSVLWHSTGRCGENWPLANGQKAECNPTGGHPCCSNKGWCGSTAAHCNCPNCINYGKQVQVEERKRMLSILK